MKPTTPVDNPFDTLALSIVRKLGLSPHEGMMPRDPSASRWTTAGKVLVVSSAREGEGKSFIVGRLARRLTAILAAPIAIVDANATHPSVHSSFKVPTRGYGFFDCLSVERLKSSRLRPCPIADVMVMPAMAGARQSALSRIAAVQTVLDELRARFALTIIDASVLARTGCLTQLADSTLLVVDASRTRRESVRGAIDNPQVASDRMLGVVLNHKPQYVPGWIYRRLL